MSAVSMLKPDARFWVALCLASICGVNLGDLLPDSFHLAPLPALIILVAAAAALALAHTLARQGVELLFWLAVLAAKSAATVLADVSVRDAHLGFPIVTACLAGLLLVGVAASGGFRRSDKAAGALFWLMFLIAGALGTAAADWSGLSFGDPKIGFPATAAIESVLVAAALLAYRAAGRREWSCWLAILVICAWGASVGDIVKFLLSMPVSLGGSIVLLGLVVLAWRPGRKASQPTA